MAKGYIIALIGTVCWSSTGTIIAYLTGTYAIPALVLAFWRDFFVLVGLGLILALFSRRRLRPGPNLGYYAVYGLILAFYNAIWTLSVTLNGAGVSTVLAYGSAGFTVLLAWLFLRESLTVTKVLAVVLSLGGSALVANAVDPAAWRTGTMALAVGILSGLLFAIYTLAGKEAARRNLDSWSALMYSFGFAALFLMIFNQLPLPGARAGLGNMILDVPLSAWLLVVVLSMGPTVLGYGLYTLSMHYLPAGIANLICTLEPSLTSVQAYVVLGERMTPLQIVGSVLVVVAVVVVRAGEIYQEKKAAAQAGAGSTAGAA